MTRKKKGFEFLLDTNWLFQEPIDAEHKEYILLSYFQKLNERFDRYEIYPSFIELSLHFANIQTLIKEGRMMTTEKKFEYCDDELLISDLVTKPIPTLTEVELDEYQRTLKYSAPKIYDYFNIAKSIWGLVNESVSVTLKKNKSELYKKFGYFYFYNKTEKLLYVWEYRIKKNKNDKDSKNTSNLIYTGKKEDLTLQEIITNFSKWLKPNETTKYSIFEVMGSEEYPLQETLLPLFKRRILNYCNQSLSITNVKKYE